MTVLLTMLAIGPLSASAQTPMARQKFQNGLAAFQKHQFISATADFREAIRLRP